MCDGTYRPSDPRRWKTTVSVDFLSLIDITDGEDIEDENIDEINWVHIGRRTVDSLVNDEVKRMLHVMQERKEEIEEHLRRQDKVLQLLQDQIAKETVPELVFSKGPARQLPLELRREIREWVA